MAGFKTQTMVLHKNLFKPAVSLTVIVVMTLARLLPHSGPFFKTSDYIIFLGITIGLYFLEKAFSYLALLWFAFMCTSSLFVILWGAGFMNFNELVLTITIISVSLFGITLVLYGRGKPVNSSS